LHMEAVIEAGRREETMGEVDADLKGSACA
ncbi:MAG: hypothetical protein H6Q85_2160, partial [candidate division NC10 bacterium]|nr:hypothetical protein [candidate division NC10 bacterium]